MPDIVFKKLARLFRQIPAEILLFVVYSFGLPR